MLGDDSKIAWLVIEKMQSRYDTMEEIKDNKLVALRGAIDERDDTITFLEKECEKFGTFDETDNVISMGYR